MNITLSEAFTHLLSERNFYAAVANTFQRVEVKGMGTMGVGLSRGRVMFFYDPDWIKKLSLPMFIFVLEHEMIHVVMDHIPRYLELLAQFNDEGMRKRADMVYQVAMDCADNELLREHKYFAQTMAETKAMVLAERRAYDPEAVEDPKDGAVLPENFDLPPKASFEFYQHELMSRIKEDPDTFDLVVLTVDGDGNVKGIGHSHQRWQGAFNDPSKKKGDGKDGGKDGDGQEDRDLLSEKTTSAELKGLSEQLRSQLKRQLKKTVQDVQKSRGTVPGELTQWLAEYLADPIVPWYEIMTSRIRASKRVKDERGIEQPNRALLALSEEDDRIVPAIGSMFDPRWRVFFMQDESGSQSDDDLKIGLAELEHLMRVDDDIEVRFIQGDASVHSDRVYRSGEKIEHKVFGRGGTSFNAYFEYMQQYMRDDDKAPDMVIVYTDGYGETILPANRLPPEIPVLWLLTPHHGTGAISSSGYGDIIIREPTHARLWREHK